MPLEPEPTVDAEAGHNSLAALALLGPVVGAAAGTVGAIFRLSLDQADRIRDALVAAAHGYRLAGFLLVLVVCATATALAAWLVLRYSPHASGSGIPHVEAVLNGTLEPAPIRLVPVKFIGGVLAVPGWHSAVKARVRALLTVSGVCSVATGSTAECFLRLARMPGWPPPSMHRWQAQCSCWKSWCDSSSFGSRLWL
jgi:hypothetical protein